VDDFEPALAQPAQGIGVTATFIAVVAVVNVRPGTLPQALLGKQVDGVAQVFVASPQLVTGPAGRVAIGCDLSSKMRTGLLVSFCG
jgi:hypothetical protein